MFLRLWARVTHVHTHTIALQGVVEHQFLKCIEDDILDNEEPSLVKAKYAVVFHSLIKDRKGIFSRSALTLPHKECPTFWVCL